jgi:hypothetical protein
VSAPGYLLRETFVRGGEVRDLDLSLIADGPSFPRTLYREMARNAKEAPQSAGVAPIRRWTSDPNVYIWTTWKDTGQPVANVDWWTEEIRRVIPQLTGFRFKADRIENGPSERPLTTGWINVQFHHSGNFAPTLGWCSLPATTPVTLTRSCTSSDMQWATGTAA